MSDSVSVKVEGTRTVTITMTESTARKVNYALENTKDFWDDKNNDLFTISNELDSAGIFSESTEVVTSVEEDNGGCGCGLSDDVEEEDYSSVEDEYL